MNLKRNRDFFAANVIVKFLLPVTICFPLFSYAQKRDTSFIEPYTKVFTGRIYFSRKYTNFGIEGSQGFKEIQYRPNTKLSIGLGATYRALTLNLGYGFSFLNPELGKGKTKYLDLQTHIYGFKWKYDLFAQFYKGYYLNPRGLASSDKNSFYKRADLQVNEIGVSAFHIYNNKRFSYRAAFQQSEWQKKSAGSFLLGGAVTFGNLKADSAFIPSALGSNYQQKEIREVSYVEIGPGAGYAYTFVWKENWYLLASATINLDLSLVAESSASNFYSTQNISPNLLFRSGIGYNTRKWNVNFYWLSNRTTIAGQFRNGGYKVNTGNLRLTFTKRFIASGRLAKLLKIADRILD